MPGKSKRRSASFQGLRSASHRASHVAARASGKRGTKCELMLRSALRKQGLRFRSNVASLPGCPDIVFPREKIAVFADGDFWHGRGLASRLARLTKGHNSEYWIAKIRSNVSRDRRVRRELAELGWHVVRVWESEIKSEIDRVTGRIVSVVRVRRLKSPDAIPTQFSPAPSRN